MEIFKSNVSFSFYISCCYDERSWYRLWGLSRKWIGGVWGIFPHYIIVSTSNFQRVDLYLGFLYLLYSVNAGAKPSVVLCCWSWGIESTAGMACQFDGTFIHESIILTLRSLSSYLIVTPFFLFIYLCSLQANSQRIVAHHDLFRSMVELATMDNHPNLRKW